MSRLDFLRMIAALVAALRHIAHRAVRSPLFEKGPDVTTPTQYQSLYTELQGVLTAFNGALPTTADVQGSKMWPQLNMAQPSNESFGTYSLDTIKNEIHEHMGLGANGVTFHVYAPSLDPSYYAGGDTDHDFLALQSILQQVVTYAHGLGLAVLIEADCTLRSAQVYRDYLAALSWTDFVASCARHAENVAALGPDWVSVLTEPDSTTTATGQPLTTISNAQALIAAMATSARAASSTVQIAAGCGTWMSPYTGSGSWVEGLLATSIDAVDCHVYPCYTPTGQSVSFLSRVLDLVSAVSATSKKVIMSECWLNKQGASETSLTFNTVEARNPFDFWYPLDQQLVTYLLKLVRKTAFFVAVAPSYPQESQTALDISYLDGDPATIATQLSSQYNTALQAGAVTSLGRTVASIFTGGVTTGPVAAPTNLADSAHSLTAVTISWDWASPQGRQVGFNLYRNGALIYAGAGRPFYLLSFRDTGLTHGTAYTYAIEAVDPWGNKSSQVTRVVTV